jgi:F-type H+-transporting ATPase subunit a
LFFAIIAIIAFAGNSNLKSIPEGLQNLTKYNRIIHDLAKLKSVEEEYVKKLVLLNFFTFVSNGRSFIHLIEIPNGELAAPTNDINTVALSINFNCLLRGVSVKGLITSNAVLAAFYYQLTF